METISKTVLRSERKRGLTLGQLSAFVAACSRSGLPLDTPLTVRVGFRGQPQTITARPEEN